MDQPPFRNLETHFTAEMIAQARWRYEESDEPLNAVAARFGISRRTLGKLAVREGWSPRWSRPRFAPISRPPVQRPRGFSPEATENLRRRYVETNESVGKIAADVGVHRSTIERLAERQGWRLRKDRPPRDLPEALQLHLQTTAMLREARAVDAPAAQPVPEMPAADRADAASMAASLALRLERAVETQLRKVENLRDDAALNGGRASDAERIARTLATLSETLFKVRRLRDPGSQADEHDDLPAGADEFRRDLARRIEAFVASRADDGVDEAGEPSDATAPQP